MIFSSKVPQNIKPGTDIITYLSNRFTYYSRESWMQKILDRKVTIDGVVVNHQDSAGPGIIVSYDAGEFEEPPANLDFKIIYEDQWFLGIDKPGNLLVHRAGKSFRNNLMYQLKYVHNPLFPDALATHRLDRDTSGVVLIAKNAQSCAAIGAQFAAQAMEKEYVAIVKGIPVLSTQDIAIPIGKASDSLISYKFKADSEGKPAITRIEECVAIGKNHAMVRVRPLTGRTHQIRIHCLAIGHPIVGDKLYGMDENEYLLWREDPQLVSKKFEFYRHALHCKSIGFKHPYTETYCKIETSLPDDMNKLITSLRDEN